MKTNTQISNHDDNRTVMEVSHSRRIINSEVFESVGRGKTARMRGPYRSRKLFQTATTTLEHWRTTSCTGTGCIREAAGRFASHVFEASREKRERRRDKKQDVAVDAANAYTGRPRTGPKRSAVIIINMYQKVHSVRGAPWSRNNAIR